MDIKERAEIRKNPQSVSPACGRAAITMVELLEWTYRKQKAHLGGGSGSGAVGHAGVSQTGAVLDRMRLGCTVSGGGGLRRCDLPDDALAVHCWVMRLERHERPLVIHYASAGIAPDWEPHAPPQRCVPVKGRKGMPKGIYDKHGNHIGCELDIIGYSPARLAELRARARETYSVWYSALAVLLGAIAELDELRRHVLTGIGAKREPWLAGHGKILHPVDIAA